MTDYRRSPFFLPHPSLSNENPITLHGNGMACATSVAVFLQPSVWHQLSYVRMPARSIATAAGRCGRRLSTVPATGGMGSLGCRGAGSVVTASPHTPFATHPAAHQPVHPAVQRRISKLPITVGKTLSMQNMLYLSL